ncbi:hypothetical protein OBBRIDRAFT_380487 [Obba rivulosa]|uniref:Uncharacterized protein n=1 Tax=Obba rivulosa TaxID=1052685 RepID=A0A8E2AZ85_9APHY|nr:hypothetical protein OBBRIDRAFT_380487 [Obba rivulosa]
MHLWRICGTCGAVNYPGVMYTGLVISSCTNGCVALSTQALARLTGRIGRGSPSITLVAEQVVILAPLGRTRHFPVAFAAICCLGSVSRVRGISSSEITGITRLKDLPRSYSSTFVREAGLLMPELHARCT